MKKSIRKRNYLIALTVLSLVAGIGGSLLLKHVLPEFYFSTYPFIPVYFFVFGLVLIYLFERVRKNIHHKTVMLYALIRMMKLLVSIIVLIVYGLLIKTQTKEFLITFIAFYLIFLVFDVIYFFVFEKDRKVIKKSDKTK